MINWTILQQFACVQPVTGILSTGLESTNVLRLFSALNIPNIKYREFSNLMKYYVIPAVYRVWGREQSSRLEDIRGKSITVASDMHVDSLDLVLAVHWI
jgi:hypothetical protein